MTERLPTIRAALTANCRVAAPCLACERVQGLDLEALVGRHGDTALIRLPLLCRRCGSRRYRIVVSGRGPG